MNVYIAGKVTGLKPEEFHKQFEDAREEVEKHIPPESVIYIPTDICKDDWSWEKCMSYCMPVLKICDLVVFLPGWEQSKGAIIEHEYAVNNNKVIWYL